MEHLGPHAHSLTDGWCTDRHDHEFLHINRVVGMGTAIDDIHHRHRHGAGRGTTNIAIERQTGIFCRCLGNREADAEDRIRAEIALVVGAVEGEHHLVDDDLLMGIHAEQRILNIGIHRIDRVLHALAQIAGLVTITEFNRLMGTG